MFTAHSPAMERSMTDATPSTHDRDDIVPLAEGPMGQAATPPGPAFNIGGDGSDEGATNSAKRSLRSAVRDDLRKGRDWADGRVEAARDQIRQAPTRALAYGLGAGVIVGLMLRR
jgi:hypothetical protein